MVMKNYNTEILVDYGLTRLITSGWKGKKLLNALIYFSGCIAISEGYYPSITQKTLAAFLGNDEDLVKTDSYNVKNMLPDEPIEFNSADELLNAILPNQKAKTQEDTNDAFESMPVELSAVALLHQRKHEQEKIRKSLSAKRLSEIIQIFCKIPYFDIRPYIDLLQTKLNRTFQFNESIYMPVYGFPAAINFLQIIDSKIALQVLKNIEKNDKANFQILIDNLVSFEDILQLDSYNFQKLVKRKIKQFAMTLKGANPPVLKNFLEKLQPETA